MIKIKGTVTPDIAVKISGYDFDVRTVKSNVNLQFDNGHAKTRLVCYKLGNNKFEIEIIFDPLHLFPERFGKGDIMNTSEIANVMIRQALKTNEMKMPLDSATDYYTQVYLDRSTNKVYNYKELCQFIKDKIRNGDFDGVDGMYKYIDPVNGIDYIEIYHDLLSDPYGSFVRVNRGTLVKRYAQWLRDNGGVRTLIDIEKRVKEFFDNDPVANKFIYATWRDADAVEQRTAREVMNNPKYTQVLLGNSVNKKKKRYNVTGMEDGKLTGYSDADCVTCSSGVFVHLDGDYENIISSLSFVPVADDCLQVGNYFFIPNENGVELAQALNRQDDPEFYQFFSIITNKGNADKIKNAMKKSGKLDSNTWIFDIDTYFDTKAHDFGTIRYNDVSKDWVWAIGYNEAVPVTLSDVVKIIVGASEGKSKLQVAKEIGKNY